VLLRKPLFAVVVVSVSLTVYCTLIGFNILLPVAYFIFALSPVLLLWLVYIVIRFGVYKEEELQVGEEWGYGDKSKNELDVS
jgi:hypothetical protein